MSKEKRVVVRRSPEEWRRSCRGLSEAVKPIGNSACWRIWRRARSGDLIPSLPWCAIQGYPPIIFHEMLWIDAVRFRPFCFHQNGDVGNLKKRHCFRNVGQNLANTAFRRGKVRRYQSYPGTAPLAAVGSDIEQAPVEIRLCNCGLSRTRGV